MIGFYCTQGLTPIRALRPGGMATLTLCLRADGTQCVVRELLPKYRWRLKMHRRFFVGAGIRCKVAQHPNIVKSVRYGYSDEFNPCEILEYCPGENITVLATQKSPILSKYVFQILKDSCEAIAYIHAKGYLHLDVKPENIIVWENDDHAEVRVTDFDLSLPISATRDRRKAGTPEYMAPEQLTGKRIGPETDVFAFGVMAYFLITGKKPFTGATSDQMYTQKKNTSFIVQEPSKITPGIAPKLNYLVMKCLERETKERFPSMPYLLQELNHL